MANEKVANIILHHTALHIKTTSISRQSYRVFIKLSRSQGETKADTDTS